MRATGSFRYNPTPHCRASGLAHNAKSIAKEGVWYFNFEYPIEQERGLDFHEDFFCPFMLKFDLKAGEPAKVIASTLAHRAAGCASSRRRDARRACRQTRCVAAADQFIVRRGQFQSVIAGYPWFADWGRDTMIALPGLTLATGRFSIARDILLAFAGALDQGMLPNRFTDSAHSRIQHRRCHALVF